MDIRANKLMKALGVDYTAATKLIAANLRTENKAKAVNHDQLVKLVGKEAADKIKGKK